ncbi:hypothetical protein JHK86_012709 [Glycine max]|nr:hypothetical protein JHK86_012709 [Glycine max]
MRTIKEGVKVNQSTFPASWQPWDSYHSDVSIDVTKHHTPKSLTDKVAFRAVKFLRVLSDMYFKERYGCHAMMLETIAAVLGMVGGMLLHLKSLRKFQHSGGWIKTLLEEAESERMHLMTMVELVKPSWHERLLIFTAQPLNTPHALNQRSRSFQARPHETRM